MILTNPKKSAMKEVKMQLWKPHSGLRGLGIIWTIFLEDKGACHLAHFQNCAVHLQALSECLLNTLSNKGAAQNCPLTQDSVKSIT
jgi:hypothetical protein